MTVWVIGPLRERRMGTAEFRSPLPDGLLCPGCGYDVGGQSEWRCPECGREVGQRDIAVLAEFGTAHAPEKARRRAMQWLAAVSVLYGVGTSIVVLSWAPALIASPVLFGAGVASTHMGRLAVASRGAVQRHALETAWLRLLPWLVSPLLVVTACLVLALFLGDAGWPALLLGLAWPLIGVPVLWQGRYLKDAQRVGVRRLRDAPSVAVAAALCTAVWTGLAFVSFVVLVGVFIFGRI